MIKTKGSICLKKRIARIAAAIAFITGVLMTPVMAGSIGFGVGVLGLFAESDGSETLKDTSVVTNRVGETGNGLAMPAGYIQYTFGDDGFVFGIEKIPGNASIGKKDTFRTNDSTTNGKGYCAGGLVCPGVRQLVKASIENHMGAYIETPSFGGLFLKAGISKVDLLTEENLGTGASYPDDEMNGVTFGIGFRGTTDSGIHLKAIAEYTDYDSVDLTSSAAASPDTGTSKIHADVMTYGLRVSIGYNF